MQGSASIGSNGLDARHRSGSCCKSHDRRAAHAVLAAALLSALGLMGCSGQSADARPAARPVLAVEVATPVVEQWPDVLAASGEIAPWQEAIIAAEIAGTRLDDVLVDVGDVVAKGQLLARYNEDGLRADLARMAALVDEAEALLEKARIDVARAQQLEAAEAISRQAAQAYRTQAGVAEAQLASAKAQRDAQALRLRQARIVAPDDGVISARTAALGAVATPGVELFRLVRRGRLEWRAEIPAQAMTRLDAGVAVELQLHDGTRVSAALRQLSPTVDARTRNGIAYVDIPRHGGLAAGMYVSGRFTMAKRSALAVPESAIVLRDGNSYVIRIDAQSRARPVKVISGRRRDGAIEIVSGLAAGDRLVKAGGAFLSEGDLVEIATARPRP